MKTDKFAVRGLYSKRLCLEVEAEDEIIFILFGASFRIRRRAQFVIA